VELILQSSPIAIGTLLFIQKSQVITGIPIVYHLAPIAVYPDFSLGATESGKMDSKKA
jgi:hypothetical protein